MRYLRQFVAFILGLLMHPRPWVARNRENNWKTKIARAYLLFERPEETIDSARRRLKTFVIMRVD